MPSLPTLRQLSHGYRSFRSIYTLHNIQSFLGALAASFLRWKWVWVSGVVTLLVLSWNFGLGVNATESLPQHLFLISKNDRAVERGAFVAFRWHGGGPYKKGLTFVKIVRGMPGDEVVINDRREVFINGEYLSTAKEFSRTGAPLEVGKSGVIPEGFFYAHTPHPDSLDSRYAITGWIRAEAVVGRAHPLF